MDDEGGNDLDDLFDGYNSENDREGGDQPVDASNTEGINTDHNESAQIIPVPKKRVVRNPRLKFDADRLCGERGIPVLLDHFKDTKFKGKGYEEKDLGCLLSVLEHWTHRLFPSMKLKDCLKQVEKLGKKRPVQTCLQKIRLDMPILAGDFVQEDEERNDREGDEELNPDEPTVSAFDQLLGENRHTQSSENMVENESYENMYSSLGNTTDAVNGSQLSSPILTEEQKRRIEKNRQLAAERLRARLAAMNASQSIPNNETLTSDVPSSVPNENALIIKSSPSKHNMDNFEDINSTATTKHIRKPAKRMRIDSDSDDDSLSIDCVVDNSLYNDFVKTNSKENEEVHNNILEVKKSSNNEISDLEEVPCAVTPGEVSVNSSQPSSSSKGNLIQDISAMNPSKSADNWECDVQSSKSSPYEHDANISNRTNSSEEAAREMEMPLNDNDENVSIDDLVDSSLYDDNINNSLKSDVMEHKVRESQNAFLNKSNMSDDDELSDSDEVPRIAMPDIQMIYVENEEDSMEIS